MLLRKRLITTESLNLLDVVVLASDASVEKVRRGSLGTVVEVFPDGTYLVEFADRNGIPYAVSVLTGAQLLKVYQEPVLK